jgi:hypothetical protein
MNEVHHQILKPGAWRGGGVPILLFGSLKIYSPEMKEPYCGSIVDLYNKICVIASLSADKRGNPGKMTILAGSPRLRGAVGAPAPTIPRGLVMTIFEVCTAETHIQNKASSSLL